jgi:hypothetical protein
MKITHEILKAYARAGIPCTISFGGYIIQCILYYERLYTSERVFILSYDARLCGVHPDNNQGYKNSIALSIYNRKKEYVFYEPSIRNLKILIGRI